MTTITLELHLPADCLPDADTDVLLLAEGNTEMQLGALFSTDPIEWIDAQGESLRVVAWAEMPRVGAREPRAIQSIQTLTGQRIDLAEPWRVPNAELSGPPARTAPERGPAEGGSA